MVTGLIHPRLYFPVFLAEVGGLLVFGQKITLAKQMVASYLY